MGHREHVLRNTPELAAIIEHSQFYDSARVHKRAEYGRLSTIEAGCADGHPRPCGPAAYT